MKNILKKKNIWLVSAIIIFSGLITYTVVQAAANDGGAGDMVGDLGGGSNTRFSGIPTDNKNALDLIKPLIHVGGGQQFISGFLNLNGSHNGSKFDATSSNNNSSVFEKAQDANSFFATIGNSWVGGRLFVGVPRSNDGSGFNHNDSLFNIAPDKHNWLKNFGGGFGSNLSATLQKVNVQGEILATNLIHSEGSDNLCISPEGSLVVCGETASTETYHWQTGTWSECSGGGSGTCSGTWTTTGTGSCTETYQICDGTSWIYSGYGDTGGFGGTGGLCSDLNVASCTSIGDTNNCYITTIECSTLGATNYDDCKASPHESCHWRNGTSATHHCSDKNGTSQGVCTGYNSACSWNSGTAGTKTRTVVCKDSSNQTVADSLCTTTKPATEENC